MPALAALPLVLAGSDGCGLPPLAAQRPWIAGERLTFDVDVMGVVKAGTLQLAVEPPILGGSQLPLRARVRNTSVFAKVRRVKGVALSWVDPQTLMPQRFRDDVDQNGVRRTTDTRLDRPGPTVRMAWTSGEERGVAEFERMQPALDAVSSVYLLRAAELRPGAALCFDLLANRRYWRFSGKVAEKPERVIEEVAVMGRTTAVSDHHGHPFLTTGPSGPLPVVGGTGWHVSHQGHVQGPDVHTEFQGRRGDKAVGPTLGRLEIVFDPIPDFPRHLGRVFLGTDHHERSAHQPNIVVFLIRLLGHRGAVAVVPGTGGIRGRTGRDPLAGGAAILDPARLDDELDTIEEMTHRRRKGLIVYKHNLVDVCLMMHERQRPDFRGLQSVSKPARGFQFHRTATFTRPRELWGAHWFHPNNPR